MKAIFIPAEQRQAIIELITWLNNTPNSISDRCLDSLNGYVDDGITEIMGENDLCCFRYEDDVLIAEGDDGEVIIEASTGVPKEEEFIQCPRCGGEFSTPSCGKVIHESLPPNPETRNEVTP